MKLESTWEPKRMVRKTFLTLIFRDRICFLEKKWPKIIIVEPTKYTRPSSYQEVAGSNPPWYILWVIFSFPWENCANVQFCRVLISFTFWAHHGKMNSKDWIGCFRLYSNVSKVWNCNSCGRHFDKRDKISAWLKL